MVPRRVALGCLRHMEVRLVSHGLSLRLTFCMLLKKPLVSPSPTDVAQQEGVSRDRVLLCR